MRPRLLLTAITAGVAAVVAAAAGALPAVIGPESGFVEIAPGTSAVGVHHEPGTVYATIFNTGATEVDVDVVVDAAGRISMGTLRPNDQLRVYFDSSHFLSIRNASDLEPALVLIRPDDSKVLRVAAGR